MVATKSQRVTDEDRAAAARNEEIAHAMDAKINATPVIGPGTPVSGRYVGDSDAEIVVTTAQVRDTQPFRLDDMPENIVAIHHDIMPGVPHGLMNWVTGAVYGAIEQGYVCQFCLCKQRDGGGRWRIESPECLHCNCPKRPIRHAMAITEQMTEKDEKVLDQKRKERAA